MNETPATDGQPVAVIVGATSKWQADGPNTRLAHGGDVDDSDVPLEARWGVGGAMALRFARAGFRVVLTTRAAANAAGLKEAIEAEGGNALVVEMDLAAPASIASSFDLIRREAGDPDVLIYNAGYLAGRALPPEQELMEHFPDELFEIAIDVACRGPFLVAKQVLPAMRRKQSGSIFFSNNPLSLRGRKRHTGDSLYYPRVMMRALAQALTEEYSVHGVHVANIIIDGAIDSPGIRGHGRYGKGGLIDPMQIAEAVYYLHTQHPSCWSHEIQLTPATANPAS